MESIRETLQSYKKSAASDLKIPDLPRRTFEEKDRWKSWIRIAVDVGQREVLWVWIALMGRF